MSAFGYSLASLLLAVSTIAAIPLVLFLHDDGQGTWDQLPGQLGIVVWMTLTAFALLIVSFAAGLRCWRQRRIALLWTVPIGLFLVFLAGWGVALLIAPHWDPAWL